MEQVNNYLKKASLGLVLLMLVAIPNLNVYSSIGSYTIVSHKITENKSYKSFSINDYNTILYYNDGLHGEASSALAEAIARFFANQAEGHSLASKYVAKNYAKYDFSGFDN